ncbi:hypothetical protein ACQPZA_13735 [Pseudonocardia xinjiangensis]|uniref:hypothetical protein n=1 Tax=Pseudonocardia xinjiangensis TaxID=75289 RepID=UPI003D8CFC3C
MLKSPERFTVQIAIKALQSSDAVDPTVEGMPRAVRRLGARDRRYRVRVLAGN